MMLKIASISDMNPMSSAVARAVSVTQMLRALFEIGSPLSSFAAAASSFVPAGSLGILGRLVAAHLRIREPAGARQRVLAHDLGHRERLSPRVDRLAGPLLGVLLHGRIRRGTERDLLALDVVAGERESPDPENDDGDAEGNEHASRDVTADP